MTAGAGLWQRRPFQMLDWADNLSERVPMTRWIMTMKELRLLPILIGLVGVVCGCQPSVNKAVDGGVLSCPTTGETRMVRTELYFGLSRAGGVEITAEEFAAFVGEMVTPRFPDGFTIVDAVGQWRDANGKISHENSKLLIVLHEPTERDARAIEEIRDQYKSKFGQESVMRVTSTAGVSF